MESWPRSGWSLVAIVGLSCCALACFAAAVRTPPLAAPPARIRLEVRVDFSASTEPPVAWTDTLAFELEAGDRFGRPHHRQPANSALDQPLELSRIEDSERVWIHAPDLFSVAPIGGHPAGQELDPVLVSTAWRTLSTHSDDVGSIYRIRVVADTAMTRAHAQPGAISVQSRTDLESVGPDQNIRLTERIGLFRLLAVRPGPETTGANQQKAPTTELVFSTCEVWKGTGIHARDTLTASVERGLCSSASWAPDARTMPLRVGERFVLYLSRGTPAQPTVWRFHPWAGYAYVDSVTGRAFNTWSRGTTLERLHFDVEHACWPLTHPYLGRIEGRVVSSQAAGHSLVGRVLLSRSGISTTVDSAGWFSFRGVPIGLETLRYEGRAGRAQGVIEVSDEYVDTLEVRTRR